MPPRRGGAFPPLASRTRAKVRSTVIPFHSIVEPLDQHRQRPKEYRTGTESKVRGAAALVAIPHLISNCHNSAPSCKNRLDSRPKWGILASIDLGRAQNSPILDPG